MFGGSIGTTLLASLIPIGLDMITGSGPGAKGGKGDVGKQLAQSFLQSTGILGQKSGQEVGSVFAMAPEARPRTAGELAAGSRQATTTPKMDPIQRIVQSDPRLTSAINKMFTESSNQQMRDFTAKFAVRATTPQGRKTLATKQPGDIKVV